jgi:hypothetical protein
MAKGGFAEHIATSRVTTLSTSCERFWVGIVNALTSSLELTQRDSDPGFDLVT